MSDKLEMTVAFDRDTQSARVRLVDWSSSGAMFSATDPLVEKLLENLFALRPWGRDVPIQYIAISQETKPEDGMGCPALPEDDLGDPLVERMFASIEK